MFNGYADQVAHRFIPAWTCGNSSDGHADLRAEFPMRCGASVPIWLVYAVGFVPAIAYFCLGVADRLGADPLKALEKALGLWALRFLIATLTVTPLREMLGLNLMRFRRAPRAVGVLLRCLHLTTYLVLDQGLDWGAIWADIVKRPYITIGMAGFVVLVPLALPPTTLRSAAWVRKVGRGCTSWSTLRCGRCRALCDARQVLAAGAARLRGSRRSSSRLSLASPHVAVPPATDCTRVSAR